MIKSNVIALVDMIFDDIFSQTLGTRSRFTISTANVWLSSHSESFGVNWTRTAARDRAGVGRSRVEMREGSKWKSRSAEMH